MDPAPKPNLEHASLTQIVMIRTEFLKAHPVNEEIYGKEAVSVALVDSIQRIGIDTPLEILPDYVIIKGHRRRLAAMHLGIDEVPCRVRRDLVSLDQITQAIIEDNRLHREKTIRQKVMEVQHLAAILKRFRTESGNFDKQQATGRYEELHKDQIPGWEYEQVQVLRQLMADNTRDGKAPKSTLNIAVAKVGIGSDTYTKAQSILKTIDEMKRDGKLDDARELEAKLSEASIGPAWTLAQKMGHGIPPTKKRKPKTTVVSGEDCAREVLKLMIKLEDALPASWEPRMSMARTVIRNAIKELKALKGEGDKNGTAS